MMTPRKPFSRAIVLLALALSGTSAFSDPLANLPDPTRAPPGLRKPPPGTPAGVGQRPAAGAAESEVKPPRLQGIQREAATGKAVALLDGRMHEPGQRQGDWTLQSVAADHVIVRGPGGLWRLWLTGGQDKLTQRAGAATAPRKDQP